MQKIRTFLWFNDDLEAAMKFYTSIFKNSKMGDLMRGPDGKVIGGTFMLEGVEFMGLNGGPQFKFTEAISLVINCETQEEIDYYWEKLTADGGEEVECGWVSDKYGLSWQVTPAKFFAEWVKDPAGLQRVTHEMWQMKKLDLAKLQKAFAGK